MWTLIRTGGPLMIPILAGSVLALGVFLERMLALRRHRVIPATLAMQIQTALVLGDWESARTLCNSARTPLERILLVVLRHPRLSRSALKERVEEVGRREAAELERLVGTVGVIASVAPLLGLLGTVTGMIGVFQEVVTAGLGNPAAFASGIWEALLTTAAGLTVGIPAYLGWRYLVSKVDRLVLQLEETALQVVDLVVATQNASGSSESAT